MTVDMSGLKPYWGKPAVRNFREVRGDVSHDLAAICHEAQKGGYTGSRWPKRRRASFLLDAHPSPQSYFQKLWTAAPTQAAFLTPSTNTMPSIRSCSFALPFSFLQVFCAFRASLNAIASPAFREPGPLVR